MTATTATPVAAPAGALQPDEQPTSIAGRAVRLAVSAALVAGIALAGFVSPDVAQNLQLAVVYALVALSMNVLVGYTGQLSLGQQGFLGLGALVASNVVDTPGTAGAEPWHFALSLIAAVGITAAVALLLGLVALRIKGLYLALLTLVFGDVMTECVFGIRTLNGQDTGVPANRPSFLATDARLYLFGLLLLAGVIYLDRCLTRTRAGRALFALKEDERAASAFGINVVRYKLMAFAMSGAVAGLAGGLLVYKSQRFSEKDFTSVAGFTLALTFVIVVVVGGLASRTGAVLSGAFFALLDPLLKVLFDATLGDNAYVDYKIPVEGFLGSLLLLITLIRSPGGVGAQLEPVLRWLAGGPWRRDKTAAGPGLGPVGGVATRA